LLDDCLYSRIQEWLCRPQLAALARTLGDTID
jgi:hypothetical protein